MQNTNKRANIVGVNIRRYRRACALTQAALAESAGVSTMAVSLIESGKRHGRHTTLKAIARALGVTMSVLYAE